MARCSGRAAPAPPSRPALEWMGVHAVGFALGLLFVLPFVFIVPDRR